MRVAARRSPGRTLSGLLRNRSWVLLAALAATFLVAACGDDERTAAGEPATLEVGVLPIADVAPLYLGVEKGFFKEEELTIKPKVFQGGAEVVTAAVSGELQVGFSNTTALLIARSKTLPVQIIAPGVLGAADEKDAWGAVLVRRDSGIKSPKDLAGKTITVNTLQNVGPLAINTALEKAGVDYKTVKYLEVAFPEAGAALDQRRVDAIWVVEPFFSQAKAQGRKAVLYPFEATAPNLSVANYFATDQYIAENSDVIDRFVRAMTKSLEYAQARSDEVRKTVPTYTQIPPEAAQKMQLPVWRADLDKATIEETSRLAKKYGYLDTEPSLDEVIREP